MTLYRTIACDPPWPYRDGPTPRQRARGDRTFLPYRTLPLDAIAGVLGAAPATLDAHLYLWTTQRFLWEARAVLAAAGYLSPHVLVWAKDGNGGGMGGPFPPDVEFLLFSRRNWGATLTAARDRAGLTDRDLHRLVRGGQPTGLIRLWLLGLRYPSAGDWDALARVLGDLGPRAGSPRPAPSSWFAGPRGAHSQKPEAAQDLIERVSPGPYLELFARRQRPNWDVWGTEVASSIVLRGKE
jgi:N6-adenosine-specific RNA methylase IME4